MIRRKNKRLPRELKEVWVTMRKLLAIGALCLVGALAAEMAAPSVDAIPLAQGVLTMAQAEAAVGRGGGEEEGGGGNILQLGPRATNILKSIFAPLLFIGTAILVLISMVERKAGMAVTVIVLSIVVGAFLLAPGQMQRTFISIYNYVL